ncbi:MAG: hypothetical protein ACOYM7_05745 [Paludibacter sp.]
MNKSMFQLMIVFLLSLLIYSCGPSDAEVLRLTKPANCYQFDTEIKSKNGSQSYGNSKLYSYTVYSRHIESRMLFGYVSECPEEHCWHDYEVEVTNEYRIGKNHRDEWKIIKYKIIDKKDIREFWRPESLSMDIFYKDKK